MITGPLCGADGWDWNGVLPFFRKLESDREFSGPLHGKDGPIKLQRYARKSLAEVYERRDGGG